MKTSISVYFKRAHESTYCTFHLRLSDIETFHTWQLKITTQNVVKQHFQNEVCIGIHISPLYKGIWLFVLQNLHNMVFRWPSTSTKAYSKKCTCEGPFVDQRDHSVSGINLSSLWFTVLFPPEECFPSGTCPWHSAVTACLVLWACGQSPTGPISFQLPTGSTAAPRPRWVRGTAAWPLWRICCSRCGKSRPSSLWRRKPSCPTRQSWTPQCWVGSPVLSGASLLCLRTSSPKSSSYTNWAKRRRNIR